ncbi:hypothetical protein AHF37_06950 [Paragonimus kellicotti]|nr:hypothetical protein AHF37_06950 [Paragonimus kellicotti]
MSVDFPAHVCDESSAHLQVPVNDEMSKTVINTEVVTDTVCSVDTGDNSSLKSTSIMCTESSSTPTATEALRRAALRTNVSRATLRIFMDELRPLHPELSLDPRTLMQTLRHCEHVKVDGGDYIHFSIPRIPPVYHAEFSSLRNNQHFSTIEF